MANQDGEVLHRLSARRRCNAMIMTHLGSLTVGVYNRPMEVGGSASVPSESG